MEELVYFYAGVSLLKPHTLNSLCTHQPCKKLQEGNPFPLDRSMAVRVHHCGAGSWASGSYAAFCTVSGCSMPLQQQQRLPGAGIPQQNVPIWHATGTTAAA